MPIQPDSPALLAFGVVLYLVFVNLLTLLVLMIDAEHARAGQHRIPERTVFILALAGGSLAAKLAERQMHRVKRSLTFRDTLHLVIAVQLASAAVLNTTKGQAMVMDFGHSTMQVASLLLQHTGLPGQG